MAAVVLNIFNHGLRNNLNWSLLLILILWAPLNGIISQNSFEGDTRNNWEKLPTNVKKIQSFDVFVKNINGKMTYDTIGGYETREERYDSMGQLLYEARMTNSGKILWSHTKEYNKKGKLIKKVLFDHDDVSYNSRVEYFYDNSDNLISYKLFDNDNKLKYISNFTYEIKGPIKNEIETSYNADGSFNRKHIKAYDSLNILIYDLEIYPGNDTIIELLSKFNRNGKLIETKEGSIWPKIKYYDENRRVVSELNYTRDNKYDGKKDYKYNENKLSEVIHLDAKGKTNSKQNYLYDINNFLVKLINQDFNQALFTTSLFTYDSHGNLIEWKWMYDGRIQIDKFDFTYDSRGNWIKMRKSNDGIASRVYFRQIEYWD